MNFWPCIGGGAGDGEDMEIVLFDVYSQMLMRTVTCISCITCFKKSFFFKRAAECVMMN